MAAKHPGGGDGGDYDHWDGVGNGRAETACCGNLSCCGGAGGGAMERPEEVPALARQLAGEHNAGESSPAVAPLEIRWPCGLSRCSGFGRRRASTPSI